MPPVKKRQYTSTIRKEQAEATRARIVEAAAELFGSQGYARTTINQIADRAGVAADTVYATFKSKGRVLTALIDRRLTSGQPLANVMDRPEALAVRDAATQRDQIARYVDFMRTVMREVAPVYEIMRSAAMVDEEMSSIYREMQGYRAANMRRVIEWIVAKGDLRLSIDDAVDVTWGMTAPELATLMSERGWAADRYWAWLEDTLARVLLDD